MRDSILESNRLEHGFAVSRCARVVPAVHLRWYNTLTILGHAQGTLAMKEAIRVYQRGVAHWLKGNVERAMADFNEAIRFDPTFSAAFCDRGTVFCDRLEYARAIADFSEAIRLDPQYARAYNNRGYAYKQLGDLDRAIADYTEAIRINPDYTEAYHNRSIAYAEKNEVDKARADLAKFNEL